MRFYCSWSYFNLAKLPWPSFNTQLCYNIKTLVVYPRFDLFLHTVNTVEPPSVHLSLSAGTGLPEAGHHLIVGHSEEAL